MKLHKVQIIENGDLSTARLFELGLSFKMCKEKRVWPSLFTMNQFLLNGIDDGQLGTEIVWEKCELSETEYIEAVNFVMENQEYSIDSSEATWKEWFEDLSKK